MKMKFTPVGRYLLIEPVVIQDAKKDNPSKVLLPEECQGGTVERYKACRVLLVGPECSSHWSPNTLAIVENSMVERINVFENNFYVVLESHVIGLIDK
jgi:hypothetical protein|tara:strand:- start:3423 stop:3716 length:294 start_codon:yes stop_codon:yes gene_type:complete